MKYLWRVTLWLGVVGSALVAVAQQPSDQQPKPPSELDRELLRELEKPAQTPAAGPAAGGEDLGQENPIAWLRARMAQVAGRLEAGDTSSQTQRLQQEIRDRLRQLIEQSPLLPQNSRSPSEATTASQQTQAGQTAQTESRTGEGRQTGQGSPSPAGATDRRGALSAVWGHLPPRIRQQLESRGSDVFLPKYQNLIEAYYRRLAEWNDWQSGRSP
ncbi:MAG: hypothetical protein KatS3mg110_2348 [Pirellulaceae bacterium]|nr:MAG: hypothetical protein KatS3mg110_2348 [Pirellulaceae bacterium]